MMMDEEEEDGDDDDDEEEDDDDDDDASNILVNSTHPELLPVECKPSIWRKILDEVVHADWRGKNVHLEFDYF